MNSASWFIYLAQISDSVGMLLRVFGVLLIIMIILQFVFSRAQNHLEGAKPGEPNYINERPMHRGFLTLAVLLLIVGNMAPERKTLYAIAASQIGEKLVQNGTAQGIADDATKALQSWIRKQIEPPKKASKSDD